MKSEQYEEALKVYEHAGKLSPDDAIPVEKIAEILELMNEKKGAVSQRKSAVEVHLKHRDVDKAIDNWYHIARLAPSDLETRSRLAMTFERLGRNREAVYEYLAVASILQRSKKVDRAIEATQRALRIIPGEKEAARTLRMLQQGKDLPPPPEPRGTTAPLRMESVKKFVQAESIDELTAEDSQQADPENVAQTRALTILAGLLVRRCPGRRTG